jgi:hypothetical protein
MMHHSARNAILFGELGANKEPLTGPQFTRLWHCRLGLFRPPSESDLNQPQHRSYDYFE